MTATELKGRLMLAGFPTIKDWSLAHGFPEATVRKVIERHVAPEVPPGPRAGLAHTVLRHLSETVQVDLMPSVTAARAALMDLGRRDVAAAIGVEGGMMTTEQVARIASLTQDLVSLTAGREYAVAKRDVKRVLKQKFGAGALAVMDATAAEQAVLYLEAWLAREASRTR